MKFIQTKINIMIILFLERKVIVCFFCLFFCCRVIRSAQLWRVRRCGETFWALVRPYSQLQKTQISCHSSQWLVQVPIGVWVSSVQNEVFKNEDVILVWVLISSFFCFVYPIPTEWIPTAPRASIWSLSFFIYLVICIFLFIYASCFITISNF